MKPVITVSGGRDNFDLDKAVASLVNKHVFVGIPEAETSRPGEPITNAGLLYIHTNGSELMGIPKRPVIEPALMASDNRARIERTLEAAAKATFDGNDAKSEDLMSAAGTQGANAAKRWFTDPRNNWPPNAPSTIAAKGSDKPLIDTDELRRAITWVKD